MLHTQPISNSETFLNVREAAKYLRLSRSTLDHYRSAGSGPRYRKHGGRVVYRKEDLDNWSKDRTYDSTGEKVS